MLIGVSGGTIDGVGAGRHGAGRRHLRAGQPDARGAPAVAARYAAVVATGRSDFPNQINNVLAFPGVFRGALDARATRITEGMKVAAADAIAGVVADVAHARRDRARRRWTRGSPPPSRPPSPHAARHA